MHAWCMHVFFRQGKKVHRKAFRIQITLMHAHQPALHFGGTKTKVASVYCLQVLILLYIPVPVPLRLCSSFFLNQRGAPQLYCSKRSLNNRFTCSTCRITHACMFFHVLLFKLWISDNNAHMFKYRNMDRYAQTAPMTVLELSALHISWILTLPANQDDKRTRYTCIHHLHGSIFHFPTIYFWQFIRCPSISAIRCLVQQ
jgi:hypothetical protein